MRRALILGLILAGCAKDKAPEPAAPAAQAAAIAQAAAAAASANANAMRAGPNGAPNAAQLAMLQQQAMAQGIGQQKTAVNWRALMPLLPDELAGWKAKGETKGDSSNAGSISASTVSRQYEKDGKQATVEIVDTAVMPALANAFQMLRMTASDGSDHYARGFEVGGNPGWDAWRQGGAGEVTVLVSGRFLVKAHAGGLPDSKPLVEMVNKVDIGQLASLNK